MPRKIVKKTKIAKTKSKSTVSLSENLEDSFREIPVKLPIQLSKEIETLKKQEVKLQNSIQKIKKQKVTAKTKQATLRAKYKIKKTVTLKKQIDLTKESIEKINISIIQATEQLTVIKTASKSLSQKLVKFTAIRKFIESIDKKMEEKSTKPTKVKKIKKPKKTLAKKEIDIQISANSLENTKTTPELIEA
ncbi:hypothetical protein N9L02_01210 [Gammaproteobacteria bacterium]|nr:hypothetical protein [Gammaproteobacteria bacterium]